MLNDTIKSCNNSILVNNSILNSNNHDFIDNNPSLENNDINQLVKDISNIMKSNKYNAEINKTDTFNEFLISLHGHITSLIREVKFLREDSIKKSVMIINLIDKSHGVYKNKENENHSVLKQKKVKILNLCTNHDSSSAQSLNTPTSHLIARTLSTYENNNHSKTNDIEKLLTEIKSTQLKMDGSKKTKR